MVAVSTPASRKCPGSSSETCQWFIHQAGTYQKDADLKTTPFYSPSVAKFCSAQRRECGFVAWGQHAHVPTPWESAVFYYTRYRDCGGGVLEVVVISTATPLTTSVVYLLAPPHAHSFSASLLSCTQVTSGLHNAANSKDKIDYNNVPWGGVRYGTFNSMVLARKPGVVHDLSAVKDDHLLVPANAWGTDGLYNHKDYGGYTRYLFHCFLVVFSPRGTLNGVLTQIMWFGVSYVHPSQPSHHKWLCLLFVGENDSSYVQSTTPVHSHGSAATSRSRRTSPLRPNPSPRCAPTPMATR